MMAHVHRPDTLEEAIVILADEQETTVLAGGTDLMVAVNMGRRELDRLLLVRRLAPLTEIEAGDRSIRIGAAVTYRKIQHRLGNRLPALAAAARTVGSPQIRAAGTIGGNLGTASPAGDAIPALVAYGATVRLASAEGEREVPVGNFCTGPGRSVRRPNELIASIDVPVRPRAAAEFMKIGIRNAMVISVVNCSLVVDPDTRTIHCAFGSVGPTVLSTPTTEAAATVDWDGYRMSRRDLDAFGRQVVAAIRPIDDHRGTADYRRRVAGHLAVRALERCLATLRRQETTDG